MNGPVLRGAWPDSAVIFVAVAASAALYLPFLGFYSDDWMFLWYVEMGGPGRSLADIYSRTFLLTDSIMTRPTHALYAATLLALFGDAPLGHHVVNTAVIAACAALFYRVLRELGLARLPALAAGLLFGLMPHYATVRFWFVTFQIPLSAATYFLALLADLGAARRPPGQRWRLRVASLLAVATSVLAYEIFMPLFFLNPLLVGYRERSRGAAVEWRPIAAFAALQFAVVVAAGAYKAAFTARMVEAGPVDHLAWFARLIAKGFHTLATGDFGLRLPLVLADVTLRPGLWPVALAAAATGFALFAWLRRVARSDPAGLPGPRAAVVLVGAGAVVYVAGYSIFLVTFTADIATTGMNNRTAMAAAMGIALGAVGVLALLASALPAAWRAGAFAGLVAVIAAAGLAIVATVGLHWGAAARQQRAVLADLARDVPTLAPGSTLLLDGACRYVGPAPVFETWWDFSGALRLAYRDNSLRGDVVAPGLEVGEEGVYTRIYGKRTGPYPWESLAVYDHGRRRLQRLPGLLAARQYFAASNPRLDSGCRPAREGEGERLFVLGARRIGFPPRAGDD